MRQDELYQQLSRFRLRIRKVLSWRYAAVCGTVGAAIAFFADIGDWRGIWTVEVYALVVLIVAAILVGVAWAFCRPLPLGVVAQLVDRRACLKDRVTSALLCRDNPFAEALQEDAIAHLAPVYPSQLFRFRLTAWHMAMILLIFALLVSQFLPNLLSPFIGLVREDRKEAKKMVEQVQRLLKPVVERVKETEATELERQIARQIQELYKRAQKGRLSKKEAMIKLNKLLYDAQKLERKVKREVQLVSAKAITAAQLLQQQLKNKALASKMHSLQPLLKRIQDLEHMLQSRNLTTKQRQTLQSELQMLRRTMEMMTQPSNQALRGQIEAISSKISQLQQMLQSGLNAEGRPLSGFEKELLKEQLQSLQQQLRALQLSKEAKEFLRKLISDPNFKEAMKLLSEMQKHLLGEIGAKIPKISPEELERMVKDLQEAIEELAKLFGDDEKIRQLAKQLLDAIKNLSGFV